MNIQTSTLQHIYGKTPRGKQAIAVRDLALSAHLRRLLILIDGERSVAQLFKLLSTQTLLAELATLVELDLIALDTPNIIATKVIPDIAAPTLTNASNSQSTTLLDLEKLMAIKQLMISSSEQHLGLMAQPLIRDIEAIDNDKKLKMTLARWNMALRESRSATQHADHFLKAAKSLLG
jgi:hypothetical protein